MLDVCFEISGSVNLQFNAPKSHCIAFGKTAKRNMCPMRLGWNNIEWCKSIKYLGVHIVSGSNISFNIDPVKRSFFTACNCIFSNCLHANEIVQLGLQESYTVFP